MEHISRNLPVIEASSDSESEQSSSVETAGELRAVDVWDGMIDLYGPSFATIYGDEPSPIWIAEISKLTEEECRNGLLALARGDGRPADRHSFPANLTEFVEACKPKSAGRRYLGTPTTPKDLRLEAKPADREHIDATLASMRRKVASGRGSNFSDPVPRENPELGEGCTCLVRPDGTTAGDCETCMAWKSQMGKA